MIKKNDFVELSYTGKIQEDNIVFDTTDAKVAQESGLQGKEYGPVIVCVGKEHVLKGIDNQLAGKEVGKSYQINIAPEDGFGAKNAQLIKLIPTNKFKSQNIQPVPGLQLNIDGMVGTVKTVSGGRTMIDFNHPLAGKDLVYDVTINKEITDDATKLKGFLQLSIGTKDIQTEVKEGAATISLKMDLPDEVKNQLSESALELIPSLKKLDFSKKKNT